MLPEAVRKARDPRFDGVTGAVDVGMLGQAYGFVDEARASELKELEESLKSTIDPEDRESIVERIHLLRDQERVREEGENEKACCDGQCRYLDSRSRRTSCRCASRRTSASWRWRQVRRRRMNVRE